LSTGCGLRRDRDTALRRLHGEIEIGADVLIEVRPSLFEELHDRYALEQGCRGVLGKDIAHTLAVYKSISEPSDY
jgi:hypothetical protein